MKGYFAFVKKEWKESLRTYKAFILLTVFFLFGMMSPLLAKLMPQLLSGVDMAGITVTIPKPTAIDSYTQLFKNLTQMGMIVFLLVFSGMLSNEIAKGTLINMLTKGLSRSAVILSKYTVSLVLWTASLTVACSVTYGYTVYLFENPQVSHLMFSLFCLWLFGAFLLAFILLSSTLVKGNFGGLVLTAAALGVLLLLTVFPALEKWNPISLASRNVLLLTGSVTVMSMLPAVLATFAAAVLSLIFAILLFRKSKL